jgi:DNA polymerase III gamma/tau subunit
MHRVLLGIARGGRIASAYLFVGPPSSAKAQDAAGFAGQLGCGQIDLLKVAPDGASIKIDQVREIQRAVRYGPASSAYQFVIIERADDMTAEAAGAFLKTLEEPPPRVVFVLLVEREDRVFPTIRSRCQKIIFPEGQKSWQPDQEFNSFYEDLRAIKSKSILELFDLSARLEKEKERIEALVYDLAFFAKEELANAKMTRVVLEAAKNLKKKANLKLTLDLMCLRLKEL